MNGRYRPEADCHPANKSVSFAPFSLFRAKHYVWDVQLCHWGCHRVHIHGEENMNNWLVTALAASLFYLSGCTQVEAYQTAVDAGCVYEKGVKDSCAKSSVVSYKNPDYTMAFVEIGEQG